MTDRELLEAAARAAGIEFGSKRAATGGPHLYLGPQGGWWNPLQDDGDALRMAVRLGFEVSISKLSGTAYACRFGCLPGAETEECNPSDPYAATRRAIVRAAAEMAPKEKP